MTNLQIWFCSLLQTCQLYRGNSKLQSLHPVVGKENVPACNSPNEWVKNASLLQINITAKSILTKNSCQLTYKINTFKDLKGHMVTYIIMLWMQICLHCVHSKYGLHIQPFDFKILRYIRLTDRQTDGWKGVIFEPPDSNALTFNQLSVALHFPLY